MPLARCAAGRPLSAFVLLVFGISWGAGFAAGLFPRSGSATRPTSALVVFPILILSVAVAGFAFTRIADGPEGIRQLMAKMRRWRLGAWYWLVLVPPMLILLTSALLRSASVAFTPNFFPLGFMFGVPAGALEEIGWTGFVFPRLLTRVGFAPAAVFLGLGWGLWHLPVVDALGAASPHGAAWLRFFLSFLLVVTGLRLLIS
jgi:CAAX protease family protein